VIVACTVLDERFSEDLRRLAHERMKFVLEHREAFVEAFVAEVGCLPSDAEMIEETTTEEGIVRTRVWFRRRSPGAPVP
jgi:AraC-like DNA-binding protein